MKVVWAKPAATCGIVMVHVHVQDLLEAVRVFADRSVDFRLGATARRA